MIGTVSQPIGPLCKLCDTKRTDQFPHLETDEFVAALGNDKMKEDLAEISRIDRGGAKTIPMEGVIQETTRGVTMERPYYFFSSTEYAATFGKPAPSGKHWPSVYMPKEDVKDGDQPEEERLWFFKDDGVPIPNLGPHRKGTLWTTKRLTTETVHISKANHRFARQSFRFVSDKLKKLGWGGYMKSDRVRTIADEKKRLKRPHGSCGADPEEAAFENLPGDEGHSHYQRTMDRLERNSRTCLYRLEG